VASVEASRATRSRSETRCICLSTEVVQYAVAVYKAAPWGRGLRAEGSGIKMWSRNTRLLTGLLAPALQLYPNPNPSE